MNVFEALSQPVELPPEPPLADLRITFDGAEPVAAWFVLAPDKHPAAIKQALNVLARVKGSRRIDAAPTYNATMNQWDDGDGGEWHVEIDGPMVVITESGRWFESTLPADDDE